MLKYSRYKQIEQKLSLQNTNATLIKTKKRTSIIHGFATRFVVERLRKSICRPHCSVLIKVRRALCAIISHGTDSRLTATESERQLITRTSRVTRPHNLNYFLYEK